MTSPLKQLKSPLERLQRSRKNTLRNFYRQRLQEEKGVDVRVTSRFWEHVIQDYDSIITRVKETKNHASF